MDTYKFWCRNKDCPERADLTLIKLSKDDSKEGHTCLECGTELKLMGQVTHFFAKVGSMTPAQRKEVLLKRSRDHSKTDSYLSQRKQELNDKAHLI